MEVRLRPATADDAEAVAAVHARAGRAAWSSFLGDVLATPDVEVWRSRVVAPDVLVAERDGVVVGFARADATSGELALLYVDPAEQGRGTGRRLQDAVLARLAAAGHRTAWLRTEERNAGPRGFYEGSGWRATGEVRARVWQGHPLREVVYARPLDGGTAPGGGSGAQPRGGGGSQPPGGGSGST